MMKNQRGSVLVGVIGISIAMSVAAGGFILLSGNTAKIETDSKANLQLHYAAESGMYMGVRWIKEHASTTTWPNYMVLTPGGESFTSMDGSKVKVTFEKVLACAGCYVLASFATAGTGTDTLKIVWQINSITNVLNKAYPWMDFWKERLIPAL